MNRVEPHVGADDTEVLSRGYSKNDDTADVLSRRQSKFERQQASGYTSWKSATFAILLVFLFAACTLSGIFVGILLTSPAVIVDSRSSFQKFSEMDSFVLKFKEENGRKTSNIQLSVYLLFKIYLRNPSIFSIGFKVQEFDFYFYPIGAHPYCLLTSGTNKQSEFSYAATSYRVSRGNLGARSVQLTSFETQGSLEIPMTCSNTIAPEMYGQLVLFANDCRRYQVAMFSVRLSKSSSTTLFTSVQVQADFEFVASLRCSVEDDVWNALTNVAPVANTFLCTAG